MPTAIITLRSGQRVDLLDPQPEQIRIDDIAHALSHICRWGGHGRTFYSVAEHSIILSYHVSDPLWGLLHDATEAYVGDMVRPLKRVMPWFEQIEARWDAAIRQAFRLGDPPDDLAPRDLALAVTEAEWLYGPAEAEYFAARWGTGPLGTRRFSHTGVSDPAAMRHSFLLRYEELSRYRRRTCPEAT